ncbi:MAG: DEAD/DEAH box helicase [Gammaproteobacteria bacterium]
MSFETFGLSDEILRAVASEGYTEPTPVQGRAIPAILAGRDIMAGAQTGTGKTAGFTLPLLQLLSTRPSASKPGQPRALILVPTRELAAQVAESVRIYGKHLPLKSTVVFGGVKINPQIEKLRKGVDILIATPGRLIDHVYQKNVDLGSVEFLVLDEADRMLDMGFIPDIRRILKMLPAKRQTLLFSATFSGEIRQLANTLMHEPEWIQIAKSNSAAENIRQVVHPVDRSNKAEVLVKLILDGDWRQVLVFVNMKQRVDWLVDKLVKAGVSSAAIHGDKNQGQRTKALADFKSGKIRVLVATDVASRGLDIDELPHVVNFELPEEAENYIHRIGRTGRAGMNGEAVSLMAADETLLLEDIEALLGIEIERKVVPGFEPDPRIRAVGGPKRRRVRAPEPEAVSDEGSQAQENNEPAEHWSKRLAKSSG